MESPVCHDERGGGMKTYKEAMEKYGDVLVVFTGYYKYSFSFVSEDGKLRAHVGGNADDIYKLDISPNTPYKVRNLEPYWMSFNNEVVI
jgi:hypothetical protein